MTCKIHPSMSSCEACWGYAELCDTMPDCAKCVLKERTYTLLEVGTGFWSGNYAMVLCDGKIEKVSLMRIYDVKE